MSRLPIPELLARLDTVQAPDPGFADALLRELELELGFDGDIDGDVTADAEAETVPADSTHSDGEGETATNVVPLRRRLRPSRRWAAAAAVVLVAILGASVVMQITRPVTALAIIDQAVVSFEDVPAFKATLRYDLNPEGKDPLVYGPQGAVAVVEVSYGGPTKFRRDIVEVTSSANHARGGAGSFIVFDGDSVGRYTADDQRFVLTSGEEFDPKSLMGWNGPGSWENVCRSDDSRVLGTSEVAGRSAHHLRCGERFGQAWELYVDVETGLVLKVDGALGGDDYAFGTTSEGGFEVTSIAYDPSLPDGEFKVAPPKGVATQSPPGGFPAFRAVVRRTYGGAALAQEFPGHDGEDLDILSEITYAEDGRWRQEVVETSVPNPPGGLPVQGNVTVWDGTKVWNYDARTDTYSGSKPDLLETMVPMLTHASAGPAEAQEWRTYRRTQCREAGTEEIAGRTAVHLRCDTRMSGTPDVWLDEETDLVLRVRYAGNGGHDVTRIEFSPEVAATTFAFEPPPGARDAEEAAQNPETAVVVGEPPPAWTGTTLEGETFTFESTKGKPTLVLLWAHWCMTATPKCDVLNALDQVAEDFTGTANIVLVAVDSEPAATRKVTEGMSFTVVVADAAAKAWKSPGVPWWVALDTDGNVRETRIGKRSPETPDEIRTLLEAGMP